MTLTRRTPSTDKVAAEPGQRLIGELRCAKLGQELLAELLQLLAVDGETALSGEAANIGAEAGAQRGAGIPPTTESLSSR